MTYRDVLDWVGEPYTIKSFAREAKARGCCRKVASWAPWLEPGISRVFLAHRGDFSQKDKGTIFGYFQLAGADVVMAPRKWVEYRRLCREAGLGSEETPDATVDFWRRELGPVAFPPSSVADWRPLTDRMPPAEKEAIGALIDVLSGDVPLPLPIRHGRALSTLHTSLEEQRPCGFRPEGGVDLPRRAEIDYWWNTDSGLYLVDALTHKVDDLFIEEMKELIHKALESGRNRREAVRKLHRQLLDRAESKHRKAGGRRAGVAQFERAMRQAREDKSLRAEIPEDLAGHASVHGSLVLFDPPYPCYREIPQAAFQNYRRIDGDDLLRQIVGAYSVGARYVEIPYYLETLSDGRLSWQGFVTLLARRTGMGRGMTRRVLEELTSLIGDELTGERDETPHAVGIPHFGKFDVRLTRAHRGVDPRSGRPIDIPETQRVRFKPSEALKELVN